MSDNKKIILVKRPSGEATRDLFSILDEEIPQAGAGEVLIRTTYLSVDPYMRNRMNDVKSYVAPFQLNQVLSGDGLGEVVASNIPELLPGDIVAGTFPWQKFFCTDARELRKIPAGRVPPTAYLGVLGLTGLTAYFGLLHIAEPKAGETVVISGAGGAVGSVAGQIARIKNCRVVGITGSDEKALYLQQRLGFDAAINYKSYRNIRKPLRSHCPEGVDIYFENVGGDISDAVMYFLNDYSRIVLCGLISLYNSNRISVGPRLQAQLLIHRTKMQGFIVYDYADHFDEALGQMSAWLAEGELISTEQISEGFENIPDAFLGLFSGENTGKQLVKI